MMRQTRYRRGWMLKGRLPLLVVVAVLRWWCIGSRRRSIWMVRVRLMLTVAGGML